MEGGATYRYREQDNESLIGQRIVNAIELGGGGCQSLWSVLPILVPCAHLDDTRRLQFDDIQVVALADISFEVNGSRKQAIREAQLQRSKVNK